jgi:hypothetical protein
VGVRNREGKGQEDWGPKNFSKIFRFFVTSIFGHMHETLNVDKK